MDTETNTMVEPEYPYNYLSEYGRDAEILAPFFLSHNLIPTWLDVSYGGSKTLGIEELEELEELVSEISFQISLYFQFS